MALVLALRLVVLVLALRLVVMVLALRLVVLVLALPQVVHMQVVHMQAVHKLDSPVVPAVSVPQVVARTKVVHKPAVPVRVPMARLRKVAPATSPVVQVQAADSHSPDRSRSLRSSAAPPREPMAQSATCETLS